MTSKLQHKPTEEQQAVIDAVADASRGSVMVDALAGCTKSTTAEMSAPGVKVPALGLAFNKKIATELQPRMPGNFTIKTFNGLGHGVLARALPKVSRLQLEERKLGKLVGQVAKERKVDLSGDQWEDLRSLVSGAMQVGIVPEDRGRPLVHDTKDNWEAVADAKGIFAESFDFLYDMARQVLVENNRLTEAGTISFDDQVYYPTCIAGQYPQYPFIVVDEAQDLNPLNHRALSLSVRPGGRMLILGDPKQCHPPGTMIQLSGGRSKPIEQVQIGDRLVSYNRKIGFSGISTQGVKITDVSFQDFNGNLVRIQTEGPFSHSCTPNHRCMVRWADKNCWLLYMMQKGNQFRIGIAQSWCTSTAGGFGPSMRARQEKADAMWILDCFDSKDAAQIEEKVVWTQFGLPDLIFHCSGKASSTQEHLDRAWAAIGDNSTRAQACLQNFNRSLDFPLWRKGDGKHIGEKTFITQACNIINGCMVVKVYDGSVGNDSWSRCWVSHVPYSGQVIGLTVESNGYGLNLYVANGIVTHNSIYGFRGSHSRSMGEIRKLALQWADRPLNTTFRCPKIIVERQWDHAPAYRAWHTNANGAVHRLKTESLDEGVLNTLGQEQIGGWSWADVTAKLPAPTASLAIICRNNGPLLSIAFKLIRQGVGVHMLGRDIGKGLIVLSKKLAPEDGTPRDLIAGAIDEWSQSEQALARANGKEEKIAGIVDKAECLIAVLEGGARDAGELRGMLEKLFARDNGLVTLSSGHKAKGLEWDCVFHLDPWRIPSRQAKAALVAGDPAPFEQEQNLRYVIETRTKHTLILGSLSDFNV